MSSDYGHIWSDRRRPARLATCLFTMICGCLAVGLRTLAQGKPSLDTSVYGKWPAVVSAALSPDGAFFSYVTVDRANRRQSLTVGASDGNWRQTEDRIVPRSAAFSGDSRYLAVRVDGDSLIVLRLDSGCAYQLGRVASYLLSADGAWLAYLQKDTAKKLVLSRLGTSEGRSWTGVVGYRFSPTGSALALTVDSGTAVDRRQVVFWVDLEKGSATPIGKGAAVQNICFTPAGDALAYTAESGGDVKNKVGLFYYKADGRAAVRLSGRFARGMDSLSIDQQELAFSKSGKFLYFSVKVDEQANTASTASQPKGLVIWRGQDRYLPSELEKGIGRKKSRYRAVIDVASGHMVVLENEELGLFDGQEEDGHEKYVLVSSPQFSDYFYNNRDCASYFLIPTQGGEPIRVLGETPVTFSPELSPGERYVVWFDLAKMRYFRYDVTTGTTLDLSAGIARNLYDPEGLAIGRRNNFGIAGWWAGDSAILLYGRYDIWRVDLSGKTPPKNLTAGLGEKRGIAFGLLAEGKVVNPEAGIWLTGYDRESNQAGFWRLNAGQAIPEKLSMGPYASYIPSSNGNPRMGRTGFVYYARVESPVKARSADRWLVSRMTAVDAPNLFLTSDLRSFRKVTDIAPQRAYNWLTATLVRWKMTDGRLGRGLLYKPENFDPKRKYPIIFSYYEKRSDELYKFLTPDYSTSWLDIPSYVSNGYLVFIPDIDFQQGKNGESLLNTVLSAARHFASLSWVDSTRMGLQGHSFAGWETNFLVTHSHCFAAACETSGVSDQVSGYDQLKGNGVPRQLLYEADAQGSPFGIGVTPWTRPDLYMANSPIFSVGKVTTPLLMMHGDMDGGVPFEQATELFLALRRAGKHVWLLQYNGAGHALYGAAAVDFTIRMQQFFDHFLKGSPAPDWLSSQREP